MARRNAGADRCRMVDAPPRARGRGARSSRDRWTAWRARSRCAVHLGLLCSAAAALGTLQLLHVRVAFHTDVGLVFVGLVVVHLAQRRRTLARMANQIVRARTFVERRIRLAVSDLLLFFITLNVLVSGIVDWSRGAPTQLPLPKPFYRWHLDSGTRPRRSTWRCTSGVGGSDSGGRRSDRRRRREASGRTGRPPSRGRGWGTDSAPRWIELQYLGQPDVVARRIPEGGVDAVRLGRRRVVERDPTCR